MSRPVLRMLRRLTLALGLGLAGAAPSAAQVSDEEQGSATFDGIEGATTGQAFVSLGLGARLKALDKINGQASEFDMLAGDAVQIGKLKVELRECRYPEDDPEGDAYAYLVISEPGKSPDPIFSGWMIASSPALNPLDHFRYDIWALRCKTL